ncbi:Prenylcysteine lyase-domain-containing protein [Fimicolochytrium jonesii]|uniref:Prenylcysteine lyase-domain-containing protein n=1 Tax=Fimicolochytrium jonesii TaxID=1396493 RepID=UPI0022FDC3CE|nr:Prenylcysteine lyase-domain-containing protein [Fimicolochytrium jonesii]KAI8822207.1 Prenylcysteine lyase-domain-containing protein [Fimicolochytrium jonesii]
MKLRGISAACFIFVCLLGSYGALGRGKQVPLASTCSSPKRIAVIGAGAAGTSFAYSLGRSKVQDDVSITILEASLRVGGRAMAWEYNGISVELGASIFLKENQILYNATREFNLTFEAERSVRGGRPPWGVWAGDGFAFQASKSSSATLARMFWRYGLAPVKTARLARKAADDFAHGAYGTTTDIKRVQDLVRSWGLAEVVGEPADKFFKERDIKELFTDEIIQAATRVNYAQDINAIDSLGALICMAAANGETVRVEGGNQQIFEHFVAKSGAALRLNSSVLEVQRVQGHADSAYKVTTADGQTSTFDAVVIAVPWKHEPFILLENFAKVPRPIEYVHLHVTLIANLTASPAYFGTTDPPVQILTKPHPNTPFLSLSWLSDNTIKIFSLQRMSDKVLAEIFKDFSPANVFRHSWDSYPLLKPDYLSKESYVQLDEGAWHLNGFEGVFSTMESQAAVGRAVARVAELWVEEQRETSDCYGSRSLG